MSLRPAVKLYQARGSRIATPPAVEPVTAAQLRAYLVESEAGLPDSEANALIAEARQLIEDATGLALITQTWELALDHWPQKSDHWWDGVRQGAISELHGNADVALPRFPVLSLDGVVTYDDANTATVAGDIFHVDTYQSPSRITIKKGATLPIADRSSNAIVITYTAGYGPQPADVPAPLARAVKQVAAHLYSHKGDDCSPKDALGSAAALLDTYRVARL